MDGLSMWIVQWIAYKNFENLLRNINIRLYSIPVFQDNRGRGILGWVDFDLGCSAHCLVLIGLMGSWQKWLSSWARWWVIKIIDQRQPNPTIRADASPCNHVYSKC